MDEFLRTHQPELNRTYFYFPAFEIANEVLRDPLAADNNTFATTMQPSCSDLFAATTPT